MLIVRVNGGKFFIHFHQSVASRYCGAVGFLDSYGNLISLPCPLLERGVNVRLQFLRLPTLQAHFLS